MYYHEKSIKKRIIICTLKNATNEVFKKKLQLLADLKIKLSRGFFTSLTPLKFDSEISNRFIAKKDIRFLKEYTKKFYNLTIYLY